LTTKATKILEKKGASKALKKPPPVARTVLDTAVRHQVYLERVASHTSEEVVAKALELINYTTQMISQLDEEITNFDSEEFDSLLQSAKQQQIQILTDALGELSPVLQGIGNYEAEFEAKALRAMTQKVKIYSLKAGKAYEEALKSPLTSVGKKLDVFLDEFTASESSAINSLVGKGYANGWTNQDIVKAIRGTRANNYQDGIAPRISANAETVVRTSVQHVANTARNETWARNSDVVVGYRIVATLEGGLRRCACPSLDGQVFPVGEGPTPPFHPNCKCTTAAEVKDEYRFLDEGSTRATMDGPVDSEMTYYDWLKTQPEPFQDSAIGADRARLLRDGGLSAEKFARLNIGRTFEPLTLDEMRKLEPLAFKRAGL
jgi:SPP1 gp7 family putative phage head morphogenesis protein